MANLRPTDLKRLHREWRRRTPARLSVALDGVGGPFNVGAILRTAAAYRCEHLWLTATATGPEHPKVGKTALGSDRFLSVSRLSDMAEVATAARAAGFRVIGIELAEGARPLHELDLRGDVCLVVGHEDHGLSKVGLTSCDAVGYLPQLGSVGSLNVASATSMAIWEWARQQWGSPPPAERDSSDGESGGVDPEA